METCFLLYVSVFLGLAALAGSQHPAAAVALQAVAAPPPALDAPAVIPRCGLCGILQLPESGNTWSEVETAATECEETVLANALQGSALRQCELAGEDSFTSAFTSYVRGNRYLKSIDWQPVTATLFIEALDGYGHHQPTGGDLWTAHLHGPNATLAARVDDYDNGTYAVVFTVQEPGTYTVVIGLIEARNPCPAAAAVPKCLIQDMANFETLRTLYPCQNGQVLDPGFRNITVVLDAPPAAAVQRAAEQLPVCVGVTVPKPGRFLPQELACAGERGCGSQEMLSRTIRQHDGRLLKSAWLYQPFQCRILYPSRNQIDECVKSGLGGRMLFMLSPPSWEHLLDLRGGMLLKEGKSLLVTSIDLGQKHEPKFPWRVEKELADKDLGWKDVAVLVFDFSFMWPFPFRMALPRLMAAAAELRRLREEHPHLRIVAWTWPAPRPPRLFSCPDPETHPLPAGVLVDRHGSQCRSLSSPLSAERLRSLVACGLTSGSVTRVAYSLQQALSLREALLRIMPAAGVELLDRFAMTDAGMREWYGSAMAYGAPTSTLGMQISLRLMRGLCPLQ